LPQELMDGDKHGVFSFWLKIVFQRYFLNIFQLMLTKIYPWGQAALL